MRVTNLWGMRSSKNRTAIMARIVLATAAIVGSLALVWAFTQSHSTHAAGISTSTTKGQSFSVSTTRPNALPTLPAGPVNKVWYFAEGRVGKGFQQYFTIDNPSTTTCSVNLQYNYTLDAGGSGNKTVPVSVAANSRSTESVNNDLGTAFSSTSAATVATVVSVNTTATPTCTGVVAERPMYFTNFQGKGISSGTDVLGSTHLNTTYSFADVPSGPNYTSYLTILNPNTKAANVSVNYYVNGQQVGHQTTQVAPNARGTIAPGAIALPTHAAAVVTSDQPVMVERPTYFINGIISGAYDVIGVPASSNDWLFAEGYTSSTTAEYLTIANVDPANTATVTITLKSQTGATNSYPQTLKPMSQLIWGVNGNNNFTGSTPEVSAEVKSTGAGILVQREMYFTYKHTLQGTSVTTQANGGTDVLGQTGPAAHSAYSFSEGYTNTGYNTWLTLQNPTSATETIYVTVVNGHGSIFYITDTLAANSRGTLDITAQVQQNFKPTDSAGNSISMTVQTTNAAAFVAERPMYWSTSGFATQGGSDIVGYIGG